MKTTASVDILDGKIKVTMRNYHSALFSLAMQDVRRFFNLGDAGVLDDIRYLFAIAIGCITDIDFSHFDVASSDGKDYVTVIDDDDLDSELLHQYWTNRNGDLEHDWELFNALTLAVTNEFVRAYNETRRKLPEGDTTLKAQPDYETDPKAGLPGKKSSGKK